MIRNVSEIMLTNFKYMDLLEGVRTAQDLVINKGIDFFPVVEKDNLIGILTYKHLIGVHSNRIIADAMSSTIVSIPSSTPIWQAKEIFENNNIDVLLVMDNDELLGIISKNQLNTELGKHVDLLTELYKSDYIYHYAKKLISNKQNASIIFIDINNFGYIDKKYGHIQGDIILKEIAGLLKNNIPSDAYLCRFGGDEFVVLAPYFIEDSIRLGEDLLDKISRFVFSNGIKINASAGIAISNNIGNPDLNAVVYELINDASLASTTAKEEKCSLYIADAILESETYEIS